MDLPDLVLQRATLSPLPWMAMELDRILIKDLRIPGILGINPEERVNEQEILINAVLWADTRPAAVTDDIEDAVNYRTVTKALIAQIRDGKPMLVERLVQELVDICFDMEPRIKRVEMTVEKPGALRYARSVGINITRERPPGQ
jgi:dihydroneopterin aldolase/D-erythro-7,8-dihydroneopterin triphosphate epimerase